MRLFQNGSGFKDKLYYFIVGHLTNMGFMLWGKGGGGSAPAPAPSSSTSYSTNVPEYAQPYVENMLNAAQAQIYNNNMQGFNPYTPYSTDPSKYIASFSPLQQQAQSGAANLSLPANYGLATGQTLGSGMQMGALGQQMGGAGGQYAAQATNPYAVQAYMNPYLQASLAPQLAEARRQYGVTGQQGQSQATQAGAFGGSREALMAAENRRNMNTAMNQMIGQGYNNAFGQAQQAQQFGANLGLQGQQAQQNALQGQLGAANQLAGLGGQQLQAQQGIFNLQNQLGAAQQTQQQNIINQAVQNYATAQQYPFMQLGILNSMLRGLPMQQSSTQMYQAPPSTISQLAGLGTAGLGALGMYNAATGSGAGGSKDGGLMEVKKMAAGGNAIPMKSYSDQQLQGVLKSPASSLMADIYAQSLLKDRAYLKSNPMAANLINQQQMPSGLPPQAPQTPPMPSPDQMAMAPQNRVGLDTISTGEMTQMAGGGLLAFADGAAVPSTTSLPSIDPNIIPKDKRGDYDWDTYIAQKLSQKYEESPVAKTQREALEAGIAERKKQMGYEGLTRFGLDMMAGQSPYALSNIGAAGKTALDFMSGEGKDISKDQEKLLELKSTAEKNQEARDAQMLGYAIQADTAKKNKILQMAQIQATRDATKLAQLATNQLTAAKSYSDVVTKNVLSLRKYYADTGLPADENDIQLDAERLTYNAFKNAPKGSVMADYMAGVTAPEARKEKEITPKKDPSMFDGLGGKIADTVRDMTGTNKTVPFNQLPTK
jgi:hypothetical protein